MTEMKAVMSRILDPEISLRKRLFQLLSTIALVEYCIVTVYNLVSGSSTTQIVIMLIGTILFAAYLVLLVYLLFFAERYGRGADAGRHINLAPLREIRRFLNSRDTLGERAVFLNVYGNVLLFVPFGAILPVLHRNFRSFPVTFAYGFVLSVTVELIQYASCRGSCDIDDVLLNTLGCTAGYVIFSLIKHFVMRKEPKKGQT